MNVDINQVQLKDLVENVVRQVVSQSSSSIASSADKGDWGVFDDMNDAVDAADVAFSKFKKHCLQSKTEITNAVRQMALDHKEELANLTVEETTMGRVDHKIAKYINASKYSPGPEYLQPSATSGRNGLAIDEFAPFGVIGNISPSTHPGPVIINNIIIQVLAGNAIVFNVHPNAKKVSVKVIQLANQYMEKAGAPKNLITCVANPTLETADILFSHPKIYFLNVTGGPMVVEMAQKYPKKVLAAGPGNPPVLVDETANLKLAAEEITMSSSFDNNILCIGEKEIFVVESVFNDFMNEMQKAGNYILSTSQMNELGEKALKKSGDEWVIGRELVGKSARVLGSAIGLNVSENAPLLVGETDRNHPWVLAEQMTNCVPIVKVRNFTDGIKASLEAEHGFGHTASVYTQDMNRATEFSRALDCTVTTINGGTLRGNGGDLGEGSFAHTIATPTGEGITTPLDFVRKRRIMTHGALRFV